MFFLGTSTIVYLLLEPEDDFLPSERRRPKAAGNAPACSDRSQVFRPPCGPREVQASPATAHGRRLPCSKGAVR